MSDEERIGVLNAKPGDMVVLEYPEVMSAEAAQRLTDMFKAKLPEGCEVAIFEGGLRLARTAQPNMDRIATALERLVELAEQAEPEITPDVVVDEDGKLMHVTGEHLVGTEYSAYVVAHDPTAAILAACAYWGCVRENMCNLKAVHDD